MGYQVLARKWRPSTFREMVGQQHVLRALINALDHDRLHHAYLFTGTRGVGKTTVARILAKCLNCEAGVSSEPCGQCGSCTEIAEGRSVDLLEVDAASRTKVEDTRELLENVQYAPSRSRFKIYLIDEVHMLSNHSFNALLKTLEEPPPHAKFLLATTDPQKLPATILSRCLQFNLKNMVPEQIVEHLEHVLTRESLNFETPALGLLARAAAGSMRDALSLTDQAIAFGSGALIESEVRDMLGTVDRGRVLDLVAAVIASDGAAVLSGVEAIAQHAPDYAATFDDLIGVFHQMTIAQMVPSAVDTSWAEQARLSELAGQCTLDDSQLWYQFAVNGRKDLAVTQDPRVGLEMTLLRMIAFRPPAIVLGAVDSPGYHGGASGKKPEPPVMPVATAPAEPLPESSSSQAAAAARTQDTLPEAHQDLPTPDNWPAFFDQLGLVGITQNIALHCELRHSAGRHLAFVLDENNATLFQPRQERALAAAFEQLTGQAVEVTITVGQVSDATPAHRAAALAAVRQQHAEQAISEDPVLASLLQEFDGTIIAGSVRPLH